MYVSSCLPSISAPTVLHGKSTRMKHINKYPMGCEAIVTRKVGQTDLVFDVRQDSLIGLCVWADPGFQIGGETAGLFCSRLSVPSLLPSPFLLPHLFRLVCPPTPVFSPPRPTSSPAALPNPVTGSAEWRAL